MASKEVDLAFKAAEQAEWLAKLRLDETQLAIKQLERSMAITRASPTVASCGGKMAVREDRARSDYSAEIAVKIPARGRVWLAIHTAEISQKTKIPSKFDSYSRASVGYLSSRPNDTCPRY